MDSNVITLWSNQCMPHSHDKLYWNNNKHSTHSSTIARQVTLGLHIYAPQAHIVCENTTFN